MRHQNDRHPAAVELVQQGHDLATRRAVQRTGWFIRKYDTRIIDDRPSDRDPLHLSTRELCRQMMTSVRQTNSIECSSCLLGTFHTRCPAVQQWQFHIGLGGRTRHQVECLEHETDLATSDPGKVIAGHPAHVLTIKLVFPGCWGVQTTEHVHAGRLA